MARGTISSIVSGLLADSFPVSAGRGENGTPTSIMSKSCGPGQECRELLQRNDRGTHRAERRLSSLVVALVSRGAHHLVELRCERLKSPRTLTGLASTLSSMSFLLQTATTNSIRPYCRPNSWQPECRWNSRRVRSFARGLASIWRAILRRIADVFDGILRDWFRVSSTEDSLWDLFGLQSFVLRKLFVVCCWI